MDFTDIKVLKKDDRGQALEIENFKLILWNKGTRSAEHSLDVSETIYFIHGIAQFTNAEGSRLIASPTRVDIKPGEMHQVEAVTDIIILAEKGNGSVFKKT